MHIDLWGRILGHLNGHKYCANKVLLLTRKGGGVRSVVQANIGWFGSGRMFCSVYVGLADI